jgi:hypothetical protein
MPVGTVSLLVLLSTLLGLFGTSLPPLVEPLVVLVTLHPSLGFHFNTSFSLRVA